MELLIITQRVDKNDPVLGFFHRWIFEFSKHFDSIIALCLEKGESNLPANVKVLSLGKEKKQSRFLYIVHLYQYAWRERKNYDAVFVHMNQEYILLAGPFWKMLGKDIYMWRNHHAGTILTDIAASMCRNVFCTSKFSYTAKYKKTILMPVGVDTEHFYPNKEINRIPHSILFLSRVAPIKKPDILLSALKLLADKKIPFTASFYGDPLPRDISFYAALQTYAKENHLEKHISFYAGIPNEKTPPIYSAHEIFVNLSSSGMYDKTIFEAMACGCLALASNDNLRGEIDPRAVISNKNAEEVASSLENILSLPIVERGRITSDEMKFAQKHTLTSLGEKLSAIIQS